MTDSAADSHPATAGADHDLHAAAERLIARNGVRDVRVLQAGAVIVGVAESDAKPGARHRVYVRVGKRQAGLHFDDWAVEIGNVEGECGCEERQPCVHVAAMLIAARRAMPDEATPVARHTARLPEPIAPVRSSASVTTASRQQICYLLELTSPAAGIDRLGEAPGAPGETAHGPGPATSHSRASPTLRISVLVGRTVAGGSGRIDPDGIHPFSLRALTNRDRAGDDWSGLLPRYVDAQDIAILKALAAWHVAGPWSLEGTAGASLLMQAVTTGRAFWGSLAGTAPLRAGTARRTEFTWEVLPNGDQRLRCTASPTFHLVPGVEPAAYVDADSGECGRLELPCSQELLCRYWMARPTPPEEAAAVNDIIAHDGHAASTFPRLRELAVRRAPLESLKPMLVLSGGAEIDESITRASATKARAAEVKAPACEAQPEAAEAKTSAISRVASSLSPEAVLHFLYNGMPIDSRRLPSVGDTVRQIEGEVLWEIPRDLATERRFRSGLQDAWADAIPKGQSHDWLDRRTWLAFVLNAVPKLQADGWHIVTSERFPYRIAAPDAWFADLKRHDAREREQVREWFDLRLGVRVDGHEVNLLPLLAELLQAQQGATDGRAGTPISSNDASYCRVGDHWLVRLEDGRYVPLPVERVQRIADTLVELFDRDGLNDRQALSLPLSHASRLARLSDDRDSLALRSDDASLLERIPDFGDGARPVPVPAPDVFRATLRPYQQEGLGWLQFLRRHRMGGILADDMGLGKTVQTLAHLVLEKEQGRLRKPSLIVAPVSVLGNWSREIQRFAPHLELVPLHGSRRRELFGAIRQADIVLTSYPLLQIDSEVLLAHEFSYVILDEAQTIRNPRAKVTQFARRLRAEHRLCLTGTPMENHLGELWSLFEFVQPGFLGTEQQFQRHYRTPIEKKGDDRRFEALTRRIAPFMLRRTKDVVAKDLPSKTHVVETLELDERQRDLYDGIRLTMHRRVREIIRQQGLARSRITVLDALLKLRQACCDPRLVRDDADTRSIPSAKMDWLRTVLPELVAEGRRVLIFSQFTSMLALIRATVEELGIAHCLLTGETQRREEVVARFQRGEAPVFLISLKAGGTGLNLTAADTVIHYDPWWNPAAEAQATDRAHRIGQSKPVFVYKLIAQGTVEEKILRLQEEKHALASRLYEDAQGGLAAPLDEADIEKLFAP